MRRLRFETVASATLIDQSTKGGGQVAPEAAGFARGSPLSPNTPYDLFSSVPEVPGVAGIGTLLTTARYRMKTVDFSVTPAMGYVGGSITNAAYFGENLMPSLNPHVGSQALPYAIAFPTHAGEDDGTAFRLSLLAAGAGTTDGGLRLRGGYFDLTQTLPFVFTQPALPSLNPAIAYVPAESLSGGAPEADWWSPFANELPLHGVDLAAQRGIAKVEAASAALPALPGESARMTTASIALDHRDGTNYSVQFVHVTTSGALFTATVPFGVDPEFTSSPQGLLPTSELSGQRQTVAGIHATFHVARSAGVDGVLEAGRSWYDASPVGRPGTQAPGGYYHAGLSRRRGRARVAVDWYRMEPRYATIILPYGVPENQWSAAFAWPGQWLKSTYQIVDNSVLGVNRQGYRLSYSLDAGPIEVRLEYTDLRQIEPETFVTAEQSGFVDGFYLPQQSSAATFGRQRRYGFWCAWRPRLGDVTLDLVDDTLYRPFVPSHVADRVSYEVPQAVLTYARHFSRNVVGAIGLGRYAAKGTFSEPIDFAQRLFFAGVQIQQTPTSALLVTFRRSAFGGISTFPASLRSPDFTGSALIVEQRLHV